VPIVAALPDLLVEHKLVTRWDTGLVFGSSATQPFYTHGRPQASADRVGTSRSRSDRPARVPPHLREPSDRGRSKREGITANLGHAPIQTTFDLYGHLMPGNEDEAVLLVDAYLERADSGRREAQLDARASGVK
jgi:hypothetical protein